MSPPRPAHEFTPQEEEPEKPKREKRRKRKRDEIAGAEIGERSVKRGWTDPSIKGKRGEKDKKDGKVKSKYSTGKECLFKTILPANVAANVKDVKSDKKDKRRKRDREVTVHEFEKTTKYPSFLKTSTVGGKKKGAREFVGGKGWVAEDGEVIEPVIAKKSKRMGDEDGAEERSKMKAVAEAAPAKVDEATRMDKTSSSGSSSSDSELDIETLAAESASAKGAEEEEEETSSSGSSSESDSESEIEVEHTATLVRDKIQLQTAPNSHPEANEEETSDSETSDSETSDSETSSDSETEAPLAPFSTISTLEKNPRPTSSSGLTIKIPPPTTTTTTTPIHPLEALYKKPKPTSDNPTSQPAAVEGFSFFGVGDDVDEEEQEGEESVPEMPFTPYTQREFEYRGLRSAAPTPDTAHANKRFLWPGPEDSSPAPGERSSPVPPSREKGKGKRAGEDKVEGKKGEGGGGGEGGGEQTEFQKWFYEHRGDTSRAWKKRRREVAKEKRQRENRKRGDTK